MADVPADHLVARRASDLANQCNVVRLRLAASPLVVELEAHVRALMSKSWRFLEAVNDHRDEVRGASIAVEADERDTALLGRLIPPPAEQPTTDSADGGEEPADLAITVRSAHPLAASAVLRHAAQLAEELGGGHGRVVVVDADGNELADHRID